MHNNTLKQQPNSQLRFTAGFPCQPYSVAGLHGGLDDPRGVVVFAIIKYIQRVRPRIVILENVKGLITNHGMVLLDVLEIVRAIIDPETNQQCYSTYWKLLDSKLHGGVPQHRERVYIVLIKRCGRPSVKFEWPPMKAPVTLSSIMDRGSAKVKSYADYPLAKAGCKTRRQRLQEGLDRINKYAQENSKDPMSIACIVDTCGSKTNIGIECSPCITRSRGSQKAFWSLQHGRPLSSNELLRLQGFDPASVWVNVTDNQLGALVGNAFTLTVFKQVLVAALNAAEGRQ